MKELKVKHLDDLTLRRGKMWNPVKELKGHEPAPKSPNQMCQQWNPVKELKGQEMTTVTRVPHFCSGSVESGEGIERSGDVQIYSFNVDDLWNPVKELKGDYADVIRVREGEVESGEGIESGSTQGIGERVPIWWNPVKELKVSMKGGEQFVARPLVESGEGIERAHRGTSEPQPPYQHPVESGEGIER